MEDTPANNTITGYGEDITFPITLENQGNVSAINPVLTVNVPSGFMFDPANNMGWVDNMDGTVSYTYPDTLMPGDSISSIMLVLTSQPVTDGDYAGGWTPTIEITMDNPEVMGLLDIDSDPDGDPTNDAGGNSNPDTNDEAAIGSDDSLNGDGTGAPGDTDAATDEDDQDPEYVRLTDLALKKVVSTAGPYVYGQSIDFTITVYNQGNVPMDSIAISDYLPVGFGYASADNMGWTGTDGPGIQTLTYGAGDLLLPGDSSEVTLTLTLLQTQGGVDNYTNTAEISYMLDTLGNDTNGNGPNGGLTDVDSDPNATEGDDAGGEPNTDSDDAILGDGTGAPGDTSATTDEDDSDPALVEVFDLAVSMEDTPANNTITGYGEDITFPITLENQGNVSAINPVLTVNVPSGFMFDPANNMGWVDNMDGTVSYTYPDTLMPGDSISSIMLVLTSQPVTDGDYAGGWTPTIEITMDNPEVMGLLDIDSDPDGDPTNDAGGNSNPDTNDEAAIGSDDSLNGDGTGAPGDTDAATDEDDQDPEYVRLTDLALKKVVSTAGPYVYGQSIDFTITVYNQGNVPMDSIAISDYLPVGFGYASADNMGWTGTDGPGIQTLTYGAGDLLLPGDSSEVTLTLTLLQTQGGVDNYTNTAEISYMLDTLGNDTNGNGPNGGLTDVDSDPNATEGDDAGGEPNTDSDDAILGDGTGAPGDTSATTDEDDSDPALVEVFDLAVSMEDTPANNTITGYGEDITFPITLENQGNVSAINPVLTVNVPSGFMFDPANNMGWVDNMDGTVSYTYPDTLMPGDSISSIMLVLTSQPVSDGDYAGGWTPTIEITMDNPEVMGLLDIDSDPDGDPTNDAGGNSNPDTNDEAAIGSDDSLNGDGTGAPGDTDAATDEDDQDPEYVRLTDLALKKIVSTAGPYVYGQSIDFTITVYNQGNVPMDSIAISDYLPVGFGYASADNMGWTGTDGPGIQTLTYGAGDLLLPGDSSEVTLTLTLLQTQGGVDNYTNTAEISYMLDTLGNDTNGNGPNGGLTDVDSDPNATEGDDAGGEPNTDSDDAILGDGTGAPGDTSATTDEDDADPALVEIVDLALSKVLQTAGPYTYGQNLTFTLKVYNQGSVDATNVMVSDFIPAGYMFVAQAGWTLTGSTAKTTIASIPAGDSVMVDLILKLQAVSPTSTSNSWTNIAEITMFSDSDGNDITDEDIDSNADTNPNNDAGSNPLDDTNDVVYGDGTGTPNDGNPETDEDDNDPEIVKIFDLALTKQTMMMTGNSFGDTIQFMIMVENQGNVPATNVKVSDYIATGFAYISGLNDPLGWTSMSADMAMITLPDTILPGQTVNVNFYLQLMMSNMSNAFVNYAEISSAEDTLGNSTNGTGPDGGILDIDSTPDSDNTNDAGGQAGSPADNYQDGSGTGTIGDGVAATDEDDHDPALITVVDIAMIKTIVTSAPYVYGQPVTYNIKVINQGNVPLHNIKVNDYVPAGLAFNAGQNPGWMLTGTTAMFTIPGPMNMWDTVDVPITLVPQAIVPASSATPMSWTNLAEIAQFFDGNGNNITDEDIDSNGDSNPTNDTGNQPNTDNDDNVNGDGTIGGDEDDSDPAMIALYDLALTKQLQYPDSIYLFGDVIEFNITLHNQGNSPAYNINVKEYIPGSLTQAGAGANTGWTFMGNMGNFNYEGPLAPGQVDTVKLFMTFQAGATYEDYINYAEISDFEDVNGESAAAGDIADADSTPDSMNGNDAGGVPSGPGSNSNNDNYVDGNGTGQPGDTDAATDEDDHDPVLLGFVDLALTKVPVQQQADPGDIVTFNITVINQGTIPSGSITVIDYIPAGFTLADPNWTDNGNGTASTTVSVANGDFAAPGLQYGQSVIIPIMLLVNESTLPGAYINFAEITENLAPNGSDLTDLDIDSDADSTNGNDAGGNPEGNSDNTVDGDGTGTPGDNNAATDEDDHDPAVICITPRPVITGDFYVCPLEQGGVYTLTYFNPANTYVWSVSGTRYISKWSRNTKCDSQF